VFGQGEKKSPGCHRNNNGGTTNEGVGLRPEETIKLLFSVLKDEVFGIIPACRNLERGG